MSKIIWDRSWMAMTSLNCGCQHWKVVFSIGLPKWWEILNDVGRGVVLSMGEEWIDDIDAGDG